MRKSLWIIALLFAAIVAPTVLWAGDITYTVNQTVGAGGVTGFIETDGTIGGIAAGNIVGWNLTLADGTNTLILTPSDSSVTESGCCGGALSATPTNLTFNFGLSESFGSQFQFNGIGGTVGELCLSFYCPSGNVIEISNLKSDGDNVFIAESPYGPVGIATGGHPVPEPATFSLMLIGIGLVVVIRKRMAQGH